MEQQPYKQPFLYITDLGKPMCSYISCYDINTCTPRQSEFLHKQAFLKSTKFVVHLHFTSKNFNNHHKFLCRWIYASYLKFYDFVISVRAKFNNKNACALLQIWPILNFNKSLTNGSAFKRHGIKCRSCYDTTYCWNIFQSNAMNIWFCSAYL
jgi:hypothetical protein